MLKRYLLIWLVGSSAVAFYWPDLWSAVYNIMPASLQGVVNPESDPFVATHRWGLLSWIISVTMFAIGSMLPRSEVQQVAQRWPSVLGGTVVQYISMPLIAYSIGHVMQLDADALIGVIMVGCVPGAMASNVLTLAARGNVSYSVSLTTSATLLSPVLVPLVLRVTLGASHQLDTMKIFVDLLMTVVGPIVAGHLLSRFVDVYERRAQEWGPIIANLAILWIIAVVVGLNRARLAAVFGDGDSGLAGIRVLAALLTINVLGYTAGFFGGGLLGLPQPMRRALTLEVGMQNAGLGTFLTLSLFPESPQAAIPTALYTFGCMLTGTILAQYWSSRHLPQQE